MAKGILKYKMVTRRHPLNQNEQPLWYAKSVQDRTIGRAISLRWS